MSSPTSFADRFDRVFVTAEALRLPAVERALGLLGGARVEEAAGPADVPPSARNGRSLFVTGRRGETVARCPGSKGHLCCGYVAVDCYLGCGIGCSYCIMKSYLNFAPVAVYADPAPSIGRIRQIARANPGLTIRVGTGEAGDSLELDGLFGLAGEYVSGLADEDNVSFELKTKTDAVDALLAVERKGKAVIGFSLNPPSVIEAEEPGAAGLEERLRAAARAAAAGYRISFHLDPIIAVPGWREEYIALIDRLAVFPRESIAWISAGTIRFTDALRERIGDRPFVYGEFVRCADGKFRYPQPVRSAIYRELVARIREVTGVTAYLCMESSTVWKNVYGAPPAKISDLRGIFKSVRGASKPRLADGSRYRPNNRLADGSRHRPNNRLADGSRYYPNNRLADGSRHRPNNRLADGRESKKGGTILEGE